MTFPADRFAVHLSSRAVRELRALPEKVAAAVFEFIDSSLAINPARIGKPLRAPFVGSYTARRGAYRIMYRIDVERRDIQIERIMHRADVYRA